jgi:hypothetical protein
VLPDWTKILIDASFAIKEGLTEKIIKKDGRQV